ncbi:16991_t:CDS:2 [Funneliformis geosporum]|uniref:16571_t:CDS:1 n=1 Tax=Funneliformis geosporum TaxID=1117311 RepID=A0A9W4SD14_9GLOM|nr:16571_t:CDS:2 [Funneliformis geosporum]CAI2164270.1 16991_t:CDS:2 [Funneliformis geosporum]
MSSLKTSNEQTQGLARVVQNETTALLPSIDNVDSHVSLNEERRLKYTLNEAFYILKKSVPILLASFLQYAFTIASVLTLGHIGSVELAALALGSMYASVTGISIFYGATTALDTLCPQGYTSGNPKMVGVYLQRAIIIVILGFIPIGLIWWESGAILVFLGQNEELSAYAQTFLRWSILGAPPIFIFWCVEKFLQAQGIMQATSYVLIIVSPINILLNYGLVWWEKIALGFIGAPIATNISNWLMLILSILYIKYIDGHQAWGGWTRACLYDWSSFMRLAIPGILTSCADWWIYELIALASGYFGSTQLAAHRLVLTIALLFFQLPRSISLATSNRVGNFLGAGFSKKAKVTAEISLLLAVIGAICNAMGIFIFRDSWGYLFTNDEEVVKLTASVLPLCVLFQLSDGIGAIGGGILRGLGKQKIISIIYLSAYYIFALPVGLLLAFKFNFGLIGLWSGVTLASILMGIGIFSVVITTNWEWEVEECRKRIRSDLLEEEIVV